MPFASKAQERASFGGYLGKEMQDRAPEWVKETDQKNLPEHKGSMQDIAKKRLAKMQAAKK